MVSTLYWTRSGQSQKPLCPLTCRNWLHSLVWLTTMPTSSHASPVCWPLCTSCFRRMIGGHEAQKKTELSRLQSLVWQPQVCLRTTILQRNCFSTAMHPRMESVLSCHSGWLTDPWSQSPMPALAESCWEEVLPAQQRSFSNHAAVKRFHHYLFGRTFTICSDHKPHQHLFSASRPIAQLASARIQCWALTLSTLTTPLSTSQALRWAMLIPQSVAPTGSPSLGASTRWDSSPHGNIVHLTHFLCTAEEVHCTWLSALTYSRRSEDEIA